MIHCLEGKSRSVGVAIAYMVKFCNETPESAYDQIKKVRPQIDIFPAYFEQLQKWYANLKFDPSSLGEIPRIQQEI